MNPTSTSDPIPPLDPRICRDIEAWQSALLSAAQQAQAAARLRELTRATGPRSSMDAATVLASAARFLSDIAPDESCDVDALLTDRNVAMWSHRWLAQGGNPETLAAHLGRLERLLRAKAGLPQRPRNQQRIVRAGPYPMTDLRATVEALLGDDPAAAAAVMAGAAAGVINPGLTGAVIRQAETGPVIEADGERHRIPASWHDLADELEGVQVDAQAWTRVRKHRHPQLGALDARRVRRTWMVALLSEPRPLAEILPGHRLASYALTEAADHLPGHDPDLVRAWLRGDCTESTDGHGAGPTPTIAKGP